MRACRSILVFLTIVVLIAGCDGGARSQAPSPSVTVIGATGTETVAVPDLRLRTEADAVAAILGAGLINGLRGEAFDPIAPAGTVVSQDPQAGVRVARGTPVNYVVSNGPEPTSSPAPEPTPVSARSWTAAITGAGLSGTVSLALPTKGWAKAAFKLRHLTAGVSVSGRVVAGEAGCAGATTIVRLPGYTTTTAGTWSQRWVFDGGSLDLLRAAARSGTPLWFEAHAGEHRTCASLRSVGP